MSIKHLRHLLFLCFSLAISTSVFATDIAQDLTATTSNVQSDDGFSDGFDDEGIDLQASGGPTESEQFWMAYDMITSSDLSAKDKYDLISVLAKGHFKKHPIVDSLIATGVATGVIGGFVYLGSFIYKKCTNNT